MEVRHRVITQDKDRKYGDFYFYLFLNKQNQKFPRAEKLRFCWYSYWRTFLLALPPFLRATFLQVLLPLEKGGVLRNICSLICLHYVSLV